jgi:hypothetical protein
LWGQPSNTGNARSQNGKCCKSRESQAVSRLFALDRQLRFSYNSPESGFFLNDRPFVFVTWPMAAAFTPDHALLARNALGQPKSSSIG